MTLDIPNQLLEILKAELSFQSHQFIGLDLSASAKLVVIWTIIPIVLLHCKPNLKFECVISVFYCKFCTFKITIFYIHAPVIQLLWRPSFRNVLGSVPVEGNSSSIDRWIV